MNTKTFYTIFVKSNSMKLDSIAGIAYKHSPWLDGRFPTEKSAQDIIDCYNDPTIPHEVYVGEVIVRVDFEETA